MKVVIIVLGALSFFSCNYVQKDIIDENEELKKEIEKLRVEKENYLSIHYDSLSKYLSPMTIGQLNVNTGTIDTFQTLIAIHKFPEEISFNFNVVDEDSTLKLIKNSGVMRTFTHEVNSPGYNEIRGRYVLNYPNHSQDELIWARCYIAQEE